MNVISNPQAAYAQIAHWRQAGQTVGLVPTMGALHAGHISLVEQARQACDRVVTTIFVNPTQFGPNEDFSKYPRTLEGDLELLRGAKADMVFTPANDDMYPPGSSTYVLPPKVSLPLEGEFRPGHFQGVATIVLKLFHLLPASVAYFGQKDYQQCQVIKQMVDELNVPMRIEICPTVRESDGLAMSSRNRYLSAPQRQSALCLWKALQIAQSLYAAGRHSIGEIEQQMRETLLSQGAQRVDYARIVDRETLLAPSEDTDAVVALIAVHVGTTRLIDNLLLEPLGAQYSVLHTP
ncbi:MAG: pantoate--beta-alanine ligase [Pirellulaceae bacterium]|nr:pantoate--beta-alanine ligase [Pirellulaceae bacterium]